MSTLPEGSTARSAGPGVRRAGPDARVRTRGATLVALAAAALLWHGCAASRRGGPGAGAPEEGGPPTPPPAAGAPSAPVEGGVPVPSADWRHVRTIRVGLASGASGVLVAGSKEWDLLRQDGSRVAREPGGVRLLLRRRGAGPVEVREEGAKEVLFYGGPGDTLRLVPREGGYVGWSGHWYRGTFRIFASQPEGVTLVNDVDLEGYLKSVLANEIGAPRDGGYEAVKAQAVAARSYTLGYLGRRESLGFDLWATVEDQVYAGTTLENDLGDRALAETRGQVLLCDGAPIRALYSSACGGRTANVEDVWPWAWTPYLRSVRDSDGDGAPAWCAGSSSFRWREEWPAAGFLPMLRQYVGGAGADSAALRGDLLDVRVRARSRCGRVQDLVVTTTSGEMVIHGDKARWALRRPGGAILRSSLFKIGVARTADGSPVEVIATGAGNGHGIGLCQWGALGMSRAGRGYREILSHYYKDTTLARM